MSAGGLRPQAPGAVESALGRAEAPLRASPPCYEEAESSMSEYFFTREARMMPHLKMSDTSHRPDGTYVKIGAEWKHLYRAVDSAGDTIEFMLSAERDVPAAKRFFKKMMRADHRRLPFTIGTDKHASYPEAFAVSVKDKALPADRKLRRVKYLNNVIEQDHRAVRRRWRAMKCFRSFYTAGRTLEGGEARHVLREGQIERSDGRDAVGQAESVEHLFGVAARLNPVSGLIRLKVFLATRPLIELGTNRSGYGEWLSLFEAQADVFDVGEIFDRVATQNKKTCLVAFPQSPDLSLGEDRPRRLFAPNL